MTMQHVMIPWTLIRPVEAIEEGIAVPWSMVEELTGRMASVYDQDARAKVLQVLLMRTPRSTW